VPRHAPVPAATVAADSTKINRWSVAEGFPLGTPFATLTTARSKQIGDALQIKIRWRIIAAPRSYAAGERPGDAARGGVQGE